MLRHIAAAATRAYVFFLSARVSLQKNGTKKNPPRIPVAFCDVPFLPESIQSLLTRSVPLAGSTSRYGLVLFFSFFPRQNMQHAEPVTCV